MDGLQGGRDTILIRFLLHRLASPPPPLLLRYLHIDQLLSMQERERRTSDAFEQLPPGLIGEKRKWMLSEKDCRQLSSAAQQGQDTSTRGVKGTQETPTHQAPAHPLLYLLSFPSFLNLATSPADHRPLTSPHVTSETFVCLPQLEDVPDSTWCWDWEAAAWWCGGQVVTRTNQTKPTWGAFEMRGKMTNSSSQYLTEMTKRIKTGIDIRQWALANGHLHNGYSSRHYTTAGPLHLQF